MSMDGTIMKMAPVEGGLAIKPGETVKLAPGGYHLMLMDLRAQLKPGETVPGTLTFEKAGAVPGHVHGRGDRSPSPDWWARSPALNSASPWSGRQMSAPNCCLVQGTMGFIAPISFSSRSAGGQPVLAAFHHRDHLDLYAAMTGGVERSVLPNRRASPRLRLFTRPPGPYQRHGSAGGTGMQRITITIDDDLLAAVDRLCAQRGYGSRSEARARSRPRCSRSLAGRGGRAGSCFGALSYVYYNHGTRDLARRLTDEGHHHGVSIASMHVHLTREDCLEVAVLRGPVPAMQAYADSVTPSAGCDMVTCISSRRTAPPTLPTGTATTTATEDRRSQPAV